MKILTKLQEKALSLLAISPLSDRFYWTGGTLLAFYYLKHRKSLDLDFFSNEKFSFEEVNDFIQRVKKKIGSKKIEFQKIHDRFEFLLHDKELLRIEFVYYNGEKKTLRKRKKLNGVYIDSLEDIAANKILAYFDRNNSKDLFDLYFLITEKKITPAKLLRLASEKFGVEFNESLFWSESHKSLSLLSELKPLMLVSNEKEKDELLSEIKDFFYQGSRSYLDRILK